MTYYCQDKSHKPTRVEEGTLVCPSCMKPIDWTFLKTLDEIYQEVQVGRHTYPIYPIDKFLEKL